MADLSGYHAEIAKKRVTFEPRGLSKVPVLNGKLKPHQAHTVDFALRTGCSAAFLDTGLGKTFVELEWGRCVVEATNKPVLMLAPLAVAFQHAAEAERWGVDAKVIRTPEEMIGKRIYVTNYDRLDLFDPAKFAGVVLDESSILKSFTGKTTRKLIDGFAQTPFRLAGTATPAPNDQTELGQHSAFLGAMASSEMLSRWFIVDQSMMGRYRLKAPAVRPYWDWVASWARCISKPSDLGFSDDGYVLPELRLQRHVIRADVSDGAGGERKSPQLRLFRMPEMSATSIHDEKRRTISQRADKVAELVNAEPNEAWVVWCDTDYEADALLERLPQAVEVRGSQSLLIKEARIKAFSEGQAKVIITKPSVAGYGLNWQHCARVAFVGLSFSYESFYQAVRRCWRFGQTREVHVHVACADTEESVWNVVTRKSGDHEQMKVEMTAAMQRSAATHRTLAAYAPELAAKLPPFVRAA